MKYSVIKAVNGNFAIETEHSDLQGAIISYHNLCMVHWNAPDVLDATIAIVDENLDTVPGYKEHIHHDAVPEVTQVTEEDEEPTEE